MKLADISVVIIVVIAVLMMVIPLPAWLLDILLAVNITLSLTVLLMTMFVQGPLEFSVFPSLLLLLTLFRLALNVSSTRLILLHGNAGEIIQAFGNFVVGGDMIVGLIVFLILVVIQFVVITKGSERVAEVAARFTLDAMPGKQMSIDADLNAGLITEDEARKRRQDVQREADFFGAMDGASKFVKGDAIAGIIITLLNLIGGFAIGTLRMNLPAGEAIQEFALLTVGDGLVAQIPSLMISTAMGILVTRSASETNLGSAVTSQLFATPDVFSIAGIVLLGLALVPGLPLVPFAALSATSFFLAGRGRQSHLAPPASSAAIEEMAATASGGETESVASLLAVDPLEIELGFGLIALADAAQGSELSERINMIRRQFALDLGFVVPTIRIRDNIQLKPTTYLVKVKGVPVGQGELLLDHFLAMNPGAAEEIIEGIATTEPAFGLPAWWIRESERERAELLGYTVVDPATVLATHLTELIRQYAPELLSRQDVQHLLDGVREYAPAVVDEVVPDVLSIGQVQKVLANLLHEGVPIRDMVTILETLGDYGMITKDVDLLTEYVRQSLGRVIVRQYVEPGEPLQVITLHAELEQLILDSVQRTEGGSYINLDPTVLERLIGSVSKEVMRLTNQGKNPIVLTAPLVRLYFKRLMERAFSRLVVLSYNELEPSQEVQAVGVVRI
ncbi:MAG: flagellar biosynthesis protein FlhA [Firmicutes bacterium]|nr:flagellar biosynthesis protein FlhA [Bacillota bacterium]